MRVAIVGSRDFPALALVRAYVLMLPADTVVISGGARGVDTVAEETARERGMAVEVYRADWERYGKRAAYVRNVAIVQACEALTAFWDGESPGTRMVIKEARSRMVRVDIIRAPIAMAERESTA